MSEEDSGNSTFAKAPVVEVATCAARSILQNILNSQLLGMGYGRSQKVSFKNANLVNDFIKKNVAIAEYSKCDTTIATTSDLESVEWLASQILFESDLFDVDFDDAMKKRIKDQIADQMNEYIKENKKQLNTTFKSELGGLPIYKTESLPQISLNSDLFDLTVRETSESEPTTTITTEIGGLPISKNESLPQISLNSDLFDLTVRETSERESTTTTTTEIGGLPISKNESLPQVSLNYDIFILHLNDTNKDIVSDRNTDLVKELDTENAEVSAEHNKSPLEETLATEEAPEEQVNEGDEEDGAPPEDAGESIVGGGQEGTSQKFTIKKVQIKPGKTLRAEQDPKNDNYLVNLPTIPDKQAPYVPMPYTFRLPSASKPTKISNLRARSPPFYLLLDHTIAVIWLLFAEKEYECPLGIVQLQWALVFLKTIHTRQGERPKDVELCINAIENLLLDQYAELAKDSSTLERLDGNVHYMDGAFGSNTMVTQSFPFSLNYAEMITKYQGADVSASGSKATITSAEAEEQLENIKLAAGVASIEKLDSVSKDKAIDILKMWKSEQVEKIRGELKRLRSIEDRMKDIDDNFQGYIEDDIEMLYSG